MPLLNDQEREELVALSLARYHKKLTRDDKDSFLGNQVRALRDVHQRVVHLSASLSQP